MVVADVSGLDLEVPAYLTGIVGGTGQVFAIIHECAVYYFLGEYPVYHTGLYGHQET